MDELERNNYAELCGTLAAPPALSHENRQESKSGWAVQKYKVDNGE